jgi:hypothetical protein
MGAQNEVENTLGAATLAMKERGIVEDESHFEQAMPDGSTPRSEKPPYARGVVTGHRADGTRVTVTTRFMWMYTGLGNEQYTDMAVSMAPHQDPPFCNDLVSRTGWILTEIHRGQRAPFLSGF